MLQWTELEYMLSSISKLSQNWQQKPAFGHSDVDSHFDSQGVGLTATMRTRAESFHRIMRSLLYPGPRWTFTCRTHNPEVRGSNPLPATNRHLWKLSSRANRRWRQPKRIGNTVNAD